ncbi:MAG: inorganic diphosphatase [Flavobacteriales bacterium]|nr:inorganic diphosphatase [Flavobacteriales bacterium]
MRIIFLIFCALSIISCGNNHSGSSSRSDNGYYIALIEIPAGTNKKLEYDKGSGVIQQDIKDGMPRVISYLAYPGNYGFVPGTMMDTDQGGDGDALDVLILGESLPAGTMIEFEPLGMIKLLDEGEIDNKIIGVPVDPELNTLDAHTYYEFQLACKQCNKIIQLWFENYSDDEVLFQGWEDEKVAAGEIERWSIKD